MRFTLKILILLTIFTSCSNSDDKNNSDCTYTPTLLTKETSNITETSATFSGQIIAPTCESTVTSQGFVYAKTTLPKTDDNVIEVNGLNISSEVTNLDRNTTYYMRAFFVNPTGEYYGNEIEFTTAIGEINITTKTIQNITSNSATSGGIINDDGDGTIINKGICWSTSQNPTIDDNQIENNTNNHDFNSNITGLQKNTTYYVRAYATNEDGIKYGNEIEFTTAIGEINITTKTIQNITLNSATSGGIINDDGNGTIINKGICWSTSRNPTIDDNQIENNTNNHDFKSEINGLLENTTYYVRAYVTNENSITYGNEEIFTTHSFSSNYEFNLNITGHTNSCGIEAGHFFYAINYKVDGNDSISEVAEGFEGTSWNHPFTSTQGLQEIFIQNNLEITIHLGLFNPDSPSEYYKGTYLDNMTLVIRNRESSEDVLNITLPSLFICTDVAYKNIINFNPTDNSYTVEQLTYGF